MEYLFKFFAIFFTCLFKFVAGPILGAAAGFGLFEIVFVTLSGMMVSVLFVTYLGNWFKSHWTLSVNKKRFTKQKRRIVKIWQKFGVIGIAIATPIFLTPIGGTIIMVAFNVKRNRILTYMFVSGLVWAIIMGSSINWIMAIPLFQELFG
ncbi:MAG: hypothetical protein EA341_08680 [Mongoliibacter sp.]|uniref:hypothetical protein n=1 Tax=Mongoliibacter sp. TaxID=2022438 RepID=UPI0012F2FA19|nr:hypothetical protein [Mongoliibacter sp.]TVP49871.1 MAG: hypothetical protein EA341_08680 [Mongoliibacter sp.]